MPHTVKPTVIQPALDITECAELFRCSRQTIRRMIRDGRLPAARLGVRWRIRREDADAVLAPKNGR